MSTIAFLNIAMHGRVNPTLPVVAELVRRGHTVAYYTSPEFAAKVEAAGATVHLYPGGDQPLPDPPTPLTLLRGLAEAAVGLMPALLAGLRRVRPDLIIHDSACPWGLVAARELGVPAVSSFTTFAFNREAPSPTRLSGELLAEALARPGAALTYLRARSRLGLGLPLTDLGNLRQPLNLVYTSRMFQIGADGFDQSYKFVGPSIGARPADPTFPIGELKAPVLYASLGTVFDADPGLLRTIAAALAPLGGTVVVATGHHDPAELGPLPGNVIARPSVPQPEVLDRAALFITHGGMNGTNEALYAGVPMLVVPQGADQPLVASRVVALGAGLSITNAEVREDVVRALARRLLDEPRFRAAAQTVRDAQHQAGGPERAVDEIERYLKIVPAGR